LSKSRKEEWFKLAEYDLVRLAKLAEVELKDEELLMLEKLSSLYVRVRYFVGEGVSSFSAEKFLKFTEGLCYKFLREKK
jgi:hypothetical protein